MNGGGGKFPDLKPSILPLRSVALEIPKYSAASISVKTALIFFEFAVI